MAFTFTFLTQKPALQPLTLAQWLLWLGFLAILAGMAFTWRERGKSKPKINWRFVALLAAATPIASLFLGVQLNPDASAWPSILQGTASQPAAILFSALPWMLAGGFYGPIFGTALGVFSGLLRALWVTHHPYTILQTALLALAFAYFVSQRYRTPAYRFLRQPLAAALALLPIAACSILGQVIFYEQDLGLIGHLNLLLASFGTFTLAAFVELLVGGGCLVALQRLGRLSWERSSSLQPSPVEQSLKTRLLVNTIPWVSLSFLLVMAAVWLAARNTATQLVKDAMITTAKTTGNFVPFFLEVGQGAVAEIARDPRLLTTPSNQLNLLLKEYFQGVPFFNQISILDRQGNSLNGYPKPFFSDTDPSEYETTAIQLAQSGVRFQYYSVPPLAGMKAAQIAFIASILDENEELRGIVIGRTDLESNPYTQPVMVSLRLFNESEERQALVGKSGIGILLDENNFALIHSDPKLIMTQQINPVKEQPLFFTETGTDGIKRLTYVDPIPGRDWSLMLAVPSHRLDELALWQAAPILAAVVALYLLTWLIVRLAFLRMNRSLQELSYEARQVSSGNLNFAAKDRGVDELGQVGLSFDHMRASLLGRMNELNRLLEVSQGVASSFEIEETLAPILKASLIPGAVSARVVLMPSTLPGIGPSPITPLSFSYGPDQERYADLDEQILVLNQRQSQLVITNPHRPKLLSFGPDMPVPESLVANAIQNEDTFLGAVWVAFEQPQRFTVDEMRFLSTLANQAALAVTNTQLFMRAEVGWQRLAAVLTSSPDPILVTDQQDNLVLANPVAVKCFGMEFGANIGQPLDKALGDQALLALLKSHAPETRTLEVRLADGTIYSALASPVMVDGQQQGRVCLLRDITRFKQLDSLKSDFVTTVSHDLREPLALMRGHATMLEMLGTLNEQQIGFLRKITDNVDQMTHLVSNLLDMSRLESGIGLKLSQVPVADLLRTLENSYQILADQKKIQFHCAAAPDAPASLEADPLLLQQALNNLVENAIRFTRAEGKVEVSVKAVESMLRFEIKDNGTGISPIDQQQLFRKMGQEQVNSQRGTRLGLAIVKSIVDLHQGKVTVESQLGKGSTFYLSVPLRQRTNDR